MGYSCREQRNAFQEEGWVSNFLNQSASNNISSRSGSRFPTFNFGSDYQTSSSGNQYSLNSQAQSESLMIVNSSDIAVITAQIQAAISVQVAIQFALAFVLSIVIADDAQSKDVYEELLQLTATSQSMRQQTGIVDSHDILVVNVDLEASVQIQILLQILLALIAEFELF